MNKKTVQDIDWSGKRALVRCDFNVPLDESQRITDDRRITEALPTIRYLVDHGAVVVLCSHLGRPKGAVSDKLRLTPVAERLGKLLGKSVHKLDDSIGPDVEAAVRGAKPGDVLLLENLRFYAQEEKNDPAHAEALARLGDVYVNDAFGAAHRAHASTAGVAAHLPAVAGFLMQKELDFLGAALENPERPFVAILGGAKISDKIGVVENLLAKADSLLIGGGMANTFFQAQGLEVGDSLVEADAVDTAKQILGRAGDKLVLPIDAVVADRFAADAEHKVVDVDQVQPGWRILDIGPNTVDLYEDRIAKAKTVVWNGPMGVFEMDPFAEGTFGVARAVARSSATSIIGGGDSAAAVEKAGLADDITHISTGGGASLEFLEGKELPGVAALDDKE
ncbi:MAG: phosphoglycerate kinase [Chloroflexi bacterium]|nr:phosphoglycerate kinase [Chloroflexota bacterium]